MTFTIPKPDWVTPSNIEDRGEFAQFQMFSPEANDAVAEMLLAVIAENEAYPLQRQPLLAMLRIGVAGVAKRFPEVHDTEPEWEIVDVFNAYLDTIGLQHIGRDDLS